MTRALGLDCLDLGNARDLNPAYIATLCWLPSPSTTSSWVT